MQKYNILNRTLDLFEVEDLTLEEAIKKCCELRNIKENEYEYEIINGKNEKDVEKDIEDNVHIRNSEQIIEDVKGGNEINNYNLLEMQLYSCIEQILKMYYNRQLTKDEANRRKILAVKKYEDLQKEYDFEREMFQEHIQNIKVTENLRIHLKKLLNRKEAITEETLAEMLNIALEIISITYKEEFINE